MNDDLNNRSSESITTVFPRLRVLLLLCAYCLPFSFFLFNLDDKRSPTSASCTRKW